jgi:hypothetical protein
MLQVAERWRAWRRRRELGGPSRAGRYSRREAYRAITNYLRRTWYLGIGIVLVLGAAVIPLALTVGPTGRAIVLTTALVSGIWGYAMFVVLASGAANQIMGTSAEQSTSDALCDARRAGWRFVNGLQLEKGWDIDHVAVGPGGVLVIETKWSGQPWPINGYGRRYQESQVANAATQAASNANSIQQTLLTVLDRSAVIPAGVFWSEAKPESSD